MHAGNIPKRESKNDPRSPRSWVTGAVSPYKVDACNVQFDLFCDSVTGSPKCESNIAEMLKN